MRMKKLYNPDNEIYIDGKPDPHNSNGIHSKKHKKDEPKEVPYKAFADFNSSELNSTKKKHKYGDTNITSYVTENSSATLKKMDNTSEVKADLISSQLSPTKKKKGKRKYDDVNMTNDTENSSTTLKKIDNTYEVTDTEKKKKFKYSDTDITKVDPEFRSPTKHKKKHKKSKKNDDVNFRGTHAVFHESEVIVDEIHRYKMYGAKNENNNLQLTDMANGDPEFKRPTKHKKSKKNDINFPVTDGAITESEVIVDEIHRHKRHVAENENNNLQLTDMTNGDPEFKSPTKHKKKHKKSKKNDDINFPRTDIATNESAVIVDEIHRHKMHGAENDNLQLTDMTNDDPEFKIPTKKKKHKKSKKNDIHFSGTDAATNESEVMVDEIHRQKMHSAENESNNLQLTDVSNGDPECKSHTKHKKKHKKNKKNDDINFPRTDIATNESEVIVDEIDRHKMHGAENDNLQLTDMTNGDPEFKIPTKGKKKHKKSKKNDINFPGTDAAISESEVIVDEIHRQKMHSAENESNNLQLTDVSNGDPECKSRTKHKKKHKKNKKNDINFPGTDAAISESEVIVDEIHRHKMHGAENENNNLQPTDMTDGDPEFEIPTKHKKKHKKSKKKDDTNENTNLQLDNAVKDFDAFQTIDRKKKKKHHEKNEENVFKDIETSLKQTNFELNTIDKKKKKKKHKKDKERDINSGELVIDEINRCDEQLHNKLVPADIAIEKEKLKAIKRNLNILFEKNAEMQDNLQLLTDDFSTNFHTSELRSLKHKKKHKKTKHNQDITTIDADPVVYDDLKIDNVCNDFQTDDDNNDLETICSKKKRHKKDKKTEFKNKEDCTMPGESETIDLERKKHKKKRKNHNFNGVDFCAKEIKDDDEPAPDESVSTDLIKNNKKSKHSICDVSISFENEPDKKDNHGNITDEIDVYYEATESSPIKHKKKHKKSKRNLDVIAVEEKLVSHEPEIISVENHDYYKNETSDIDNNFHDAIDDADASEVISKKRKKKHHKKDKGNDNEMILGDSGNKKQRKEKDKDFSLISYNSYINENETENEYKNNELVSTDVSEEGEAVNLIKNTFSFEKDDTTNTCDGKFETSNTDFSESVEKRNRDHRVISESDEQSDSAQISNRSTHKQPKDRGSVNESHQSLILESNSTVDSSTKTKNLLQTALISDDSSVNETETGNQCKHNELVSTDMTEGEETVNFINIFENNNTFNNCDSTFKTCDLTFSNSVGKNISDNHVMSESDEQFDSTQNSNDLDRRSPKKHKLANADQKSQDGESVDEAHQSLIPQSNARSDSSSENSDTFNNCDSIFKTCHLTFSNSVGKNISDNHVRSESDEQSNSTQNSNDLDRRSPKKHNLANADQKLQDGESVDEAHQSLIPQSNARSDSSSENSDTFNNCDSTSNTCDLIVSDSVEKSISDNIVISESEEQSDSTQNSNDLDRSSPKKHKVTNTDQKSQDGESDNEVHQSLILQSNASRDSSSEDENFLRTDQNVNRRTKKRTECRSNFKSSSYFNFEEDPVDFEVPMLHQKETLSSLTKHQKMTLLENNVVIRTGLFSFKEDQIIKKNFEEFGLKYGISDPLELLGIGRYGIDKNMSKFIRAKHFYVRLGKGLNNRTLHSIYKRARRILHPSRTKSKLEEIDLSKLKKLNTSNPNKWSYISDVLGREPDNILAVNRWHKKPISKGDWTEEEKEQLVKAIEKVSGSSGVSCDKIQTIDWEEVSASIPTRNSSQCRFYWALHLGWKSSSKKMKWDHSCYVKLLKILAKDWFVDEMSRADWQKVHESFVDVTPTYISLQKRWYYLKYTVPGYAVKSHKDILRILCKKYNIDIEYKDK